MSPRNKLRARSAWLFLLVFSMAAGLCEGSPPSDLDDLWDAATKAYRSNDYVRAANLYDTFSEKADALAKPSPEARFNSGIAYWRAKQPGLAAFRLLQAAYRQNSPFKVHHNALLLSEMEREQGMKDGITTHPLFFFMLWIGPDILIFLFALAAWVGAGWLVLYWIGSPIPGHLENLTPRKRKRKLRSYGLFPIGFVAVFFIALLLGRGYAKLGVLSGVSDGIALFKLPEDKPDSRLVNLPEGTVVTLGKKEGEFTQIIQPVAGWVASSRVLIVD